MGVPSDPKNRFIGIPRGSYNKNEYGSLGIPRDSLKGIIVALGIHRDFNKGLLRIGIPRDP
jgi:hypothetical protein